jgi:hypothetical protein
MPQFLFIVAVHFKGGIFCCFSENINIQHLPVHTLEMMVWKREFGVGFVFSLFTSFCTVVVGGFSRHHLLQDEERKRKRSNIIIATTPFDLLRLVLMMILSDATLLLLLRVH